MFREANARIKAAQLLFERARLARSYEGRARSAGIAYDESTVPRRVAERLRSRGIDTGAWPARLRVLWIGADMHQDQGGFLQGLQRNADVTCFHRPTGEYGQRLKGADGLIRDYDAEVIAENDAQLERMVRELYDAGRPPHVVMGQLWAQHLSVDALRQVQSQGIATVNVSMDDRLPVHWRNRDGYRPGAVGLVDGLDLVLTTSSEVCLWYEVEGCRALWWPLASDPAFFEPAPEEAKVHDISFVGNRYGVRSHIVAALESAGIRVAAYGSGWPNGSIGADQVKRVFTESRMILGVGTVAHNRSVYTLKLRDFDAPMAGALYITHRNPDLLPLFKEGEEIEYYESNVELVRKVRFYLANPDRRREVARSGRERALRDHTWDVRLAQAFAVIRGNAPRQRPHTL